MERRFTALRVTATVFKVLAWLVLFLGILSAVLVLILGITTAGALDLLNVGLGGPLVGISGFVVILIITVVQFMVLYAVGESAYLFLSIEENTRRSAYFIQQLFTAQQPTYPPQVVLDHPEQSPPA
jgi:hypothetical protein